MFDTHAAVTIDARHAPWRAGGHDAPRRLSPTLAESVLDMSAPGMAVFDAKGRVIYINAEARRRLSEAGWIAGADRLRPQHASDDEALARALRLVCGSGKVCLVSLCGDGGESAALKPMVADDQRYAALVLGREALCGALELQLFASRTELTPTECRVLQGLARGLRPAQIAREHGVALNTVLSQVATVRSKTRCASIHDLLALLARLPVLGQVR